MKFTAAKLVKIQELWSEASLFLEERIEEMKRAEGSGVLGLEYLLKYKIDNYYLIAKFSDTYGDKVYEEYKLPLDILFNDDFYYIMVARVKEERRVQEERQKVIEINQMKRLMEKYKDEIKQ